MFSVTQSLTREKQIHPFALSLVLHVTIIVIAGWGGFFSLHHGEIKDRVVVLEMVTITDETNASLLPVKKKPASKSKLTPSPGSGSNAAPAPKPAPAPEPTLAPDSTPIAKPTRTKPARIKPTPPKPTPTASQATRPSFAKPTPKPTPPDPFASVLKTVENLPTSLPEKPDKKKKPQRDTDVQPTALSFDEQMEATLKVVSTKEPTGKPISMSVRDAVAAQLRPCWSVPAGMEGARDMIIAIRAIMRKDATVERAIIIDTARMNRDPLFKIAAESALRATRNDKCQPLPLPPERYEQWRVLVLNFDPRDLL